MKKLKKRLYNLRLSNFINNKITYDKDQDKALIKFYES